MRSGLEKIILGIMGWLLLGLIGHFLTAPVREQDKRNASSRGLGCGNGECLIEDDPPEARYFRR
jgi:hypothetical protein